MKKLKSLCFFFVIGLGMFCLRAQEAAVPTYDAYLLEGECIPFPKFGFNGKVELNGVNVWGDTEFKNLLGATEPGFIRYPGGTAANAWNWVPFCMDDLGNKTYYWKDSELLCAGDEIYESSSLSKKEVLEFGCSFQCATSVSNYAEDYKCIVNTKDWKLDDFKGAMADMGTKPVYVLRMMDPLVQAELADGNLFNARTKIKDSLIASIQRQVVKILSVYAAGGTAIPGIDLNDIGNTFNNSNLEYAGEIHFELGNELYAGRYGRFFPSAGCFAPDVDLCDTKGCNENDCKPSPKYYAALCNLVIPIIRSKFTNAKISVVGGNRNKPAHDWSLKVFDNITVSYEAMTFHAYPVVDTKDEEVVDLSFVNSSLIGHFAYEDDLGIADSLIKYNKQLWITEYNIGDEVLPEFSYNWRNVLVFSDVINAYLLRLKDLNSSQFDLFLNAADQYPISMMLAQKVAGKFKSNNSAIVPYACDTENYALTAFGAGMYLWNAVAKGANYASPIFFSQQPSEPPNSNYYHANDTTGKLFCLEKTIIDTFPKVYGWKFNNGKIIVVNHSDNAINLIGSAISSGAVLQYASHTSSNLLDTLLALPVDFPFVDPGSVAYHSCANQDYSGSIESNWTFSPILKPNSITMLRTDLNCPMPEAAAKFISTLTNKELKIFPNPAIDNFQIEIPVGFDHGELRIYDLRGQLVRQHYVDASMNKHALELPPSGIYIVVLKTSQRKWTQKLISLK